MNQINIGAVYTTALTIALAFAITFINIINLERAKTKFFHILAKLNEMFVLVAGVYFIMFSYEALENYESFILSKGPYDKYAITFCIYYGIVQVSLYVAFKILRFFGRNTRLIKKK